MILDLQPSTCLTYKEQLYKVSEHHLTHCSLYFTAVYSNKRSDEPVLHYLLNAKQQTHTISIELVTKVEHLAAKKTNVTAQKQLNTESGGKKNNSELMKWCSVSVGCGKRQLYVFSLLDYMYYKVYNTTVSSGQVI